MDEKLYEILKTKESDKAAQRDAIFFAKYAAKRIDLMAPSVIARLRAIVAENHLAEDAIDEVWGLLELSH